MWQCIDNLTPSWQVYETVDLDLTCWYPFILVEIKSVKLLDSYLVDPNQGDNYQQSNKATFKH